MISWLACGTNVIGLQCVDSLGNINLDYLALALYSTTPISDLGLSFALSSTGPVANVISDPVPGLTLRSWIGTASLSDSEAWKTVTNFVSVGSGVFD